jgi:hypothetical protein
MLLGPFNHLSPSFGFVSGHDFSRAVKAKKEWGFTGCGKTLFFEGYGLQPVHKQLKTGTALAAEGRIFVLLPTFSASCLAPADFTVAG